MKQGARVGRDGRVILASEDREAETLERASEQAHREYEKRIEQLEDDVSFLARFIQLLQEGHTTPPEHARRREIDERTERVALS